MRWTRELTSKEGVISACAWKTPRSPVFPRRTGHHLEDSLVKLKGLALFAETYGSAFPASRL